MSKFKEGYLLNRQEYGCLYPYLVKEEVRQVYWNGRGMWIEEDGRGRYFVNDRPDEGFVERFSMLVGNQCGQRFNKSHPVMVWAGENMTIQMVHESVAAHGTTILLKKRRKLARMSAGEITEAGICEQEAVPVLKEIIRSGLSFLMHGVGGERMDMLALFMTRYLEPEERVVVLTGEQGPDPVADNPDKDITSIRIWDHENPEWLYKCIRGMEPSWIWSLYPDGETVREIMHLTEAYPVHAGLVIAGGRDPESLALSLFPETEEGRLSDALKRCFPVRILMAEAGLDRIVSLDRARQQIRYERKTGR